MIFTQLNSIFIYSILKTHIDGNGKTLLLTFLDMIILSIYPFFNIIDPDFADIFNYNDVETNLVDIPIV
mgnify:CR=1 FL=1